MLITNGTILHATPALNDTDFEGAIIFIAEHNDKGAMGFVINKPFGRALNELVEFKNSPAISLYDGGPMDKEHLFFIHSRPDLIGGGSLIKDGIYLGGDFKTAVTHLNHHSILGNEIKIFVGYCGWDKGEVEAEVKEGSWVEGKFLVFSS